jgi:lysophospholipase L1-like esterase
MKKYILIIFLFLSLIGNTKEVTRSSRFLSYPSDIIIGSVPVWLFNNFSAITNTEIPLIVGDSVTMYGDALLNVPIINNLSVDYICDIGVEVGNNLCIKPILNDIGPHTCIIKYYNNGYKYLTDTTILTVYNKSSIDTIKLLLIGNSLLAGGISYDYTYIKSIIDSVNIKFIGSTGTINKYCEAWPGKSYIWMVNDTASPFVNALGDVDLHAYFTDNEIDTPDFIMIRLGVNDVKSLIPTQMLTTEQLYNIEISCKTLIDSFLAFNNDIKILIGVPTSCDNTAYGWDAGYVSTLDQDSYIQGINQLRKVLIDIFANGNYNDRVDCSYEAYFLNRETGYSRTDGIHPTPLGYTQLAISMGIELNKKLAPVIIE